MGEESVTRAVASAAEAVKGRDERAARKAARRALDSLPRSGWKVNKGATAPRLKTAPDYLIQPDFLSRQWGVPYFEGLLFAMLKVNKTFNELTQDALAAGRVDSRTSAILEKTRNFRNLVHLNKFKEPYITRTEAMDIRTVMDKLIKKL